MFSLNEEIDVCETNLISSNVHDATMAVGVISRAILILKQSAEECVVSSIALDNGRNSLIIHNVKNSKNNQQTRQQNHRKQQQKQFQSIANALAKRVEAARQTLQHQEQQALSKVDLLSRVVNKLRQRYGGDVDNHDLKTNLPSKQSTLIRLVDNDDNYNNNNNNNDDDDDNENDDNQHFSSTNNTNNQSSSSSSLSSSSSSSSSLIINDFRMKQDNLMHNRWLASCSIRFNSAHQPQPTSIVKLEMIAIDSNQCVLNAHSCVQTAPTTDVAAHDSRCDDGSLFNSDHTESIVVCCNVECVNTVLNGERKAPTFALHWRQIDIEGDAADVWQILNLTGVSKHPMQCNKGSFLSVFILFAVF